MTVMLYDEKQNGFTLPHCASPGGEEIIKKQQTTRLCRSTTALTATKASRVPACDLFNGSRFCFAKSQETEN
jgi:hypothetical protein